MMNSQKPISSKIAIIGAGISGIAAAKQLYKHNPVVFEATNSIGGVWRHASFETTKLQTPRCDYEFSDFPWPDRDNSTFPSHRDILEYLHDYANHFDILKFVNFNSKVVQLRFIGSGPVETDPSLYEAKTEYGKLLNGQPSWELVVQNDNSHIIQVYQFEFVVICMGKYGDIPQIPKFEPNKGPEIFKGQVLHALDYCKLSKEETYDLFKEKKVAIVGYKKSAIDLAVECAEANQGEGGQACTMVIRTLHWVVPHYWIWGLPFYLFYSTRSSQFLHQKPYRDTNRLFSHLRRGVSKIVESYLLWKLPLEKFGLKPDHAFEEDYASCQMAILPENFFSEASEGRIKFKKTGSNKWWFNENGLEFSDGSKLEADVVVLATGYDGKKKLKNIFPQPFTNFLEYIDGIIPLYRGTINPMIPNMAFVGYVETVSNLQTAELRCKWLSKLVDEQMKVPSTVKMLENIAEEVKVMKTTTRFYKRHCISTFNINHNDEICEDMGWSSWRKNTWLNEAFSPYTSQDYKDMNM